MQLGQRTTRCREVTGPTPHSVAVRAKFPSWRPADHLIQERLRKDAARDQLLEFTWDIQTCDVKNAWLDSTDRRFLRGTVQRLVRANLSQYRSDVDERRRRLQALLEAEEQQLLQEVEEKRRLTEVERLAKMKEETKILRETRESERQQLVSDKLEQLYREQCEELRTTQFRHRERQVCSERAAQVRSRQEQPQRQKEEDQLFCELWEADRRAKEEREGQRERGQQQKKEEQLNFLKVQMEAAEQQRQKDKELRKEEARRMMQQQEAQLLQEQQEQHQKLEAQLTRRQQLDRGVWLKTRRLTHKWQDEQRLDMSVLQQQVTQETDEKQEAAQRKAALWEEQRRYRQYLSEERQRQRREEEETERLMKEKMEETWTRREEQSRQQREARSQLMNEVMEARRLQIQQNLNLTNHRKAELAREREELRGVIEEMKATDEEEQRRQRLTRQAYQADLRAQMAHQQQLRSQDKAQAQREHQQGLIQQQLFDQKKDQILSRPTSHNIDLHPFRRAEGSRFPPSLHR